ncbi:MAG: hypothetical protein Q9162_001758 [Coniocarpon cinnabarinum]
MANLIRHEADVPRKSIQRDWERAMRSSSRSPKLLFSTGDVLESLRFRHHSAPPHLPGTDPQDAAAQQSATQELSSEQSSFEMLVDALDFSDSDDEQSNDKSKQVISLETDDEVPLKQLKRRAVTDNERKSSAELDTDDDVPLMQLKRPVATGTKRKIGADDAGTGQPAPKRVAQSSASKLPAPKPTNMDSKKSRQPKNKGNAWTAEEENMCIALVRSLRSGSTFKSVEKLWPQVAEEMAKQGTDRSGSAIKNYWNRHLRAKSGFDERINPRADAMSTGTLDGKKVGRLLKGQAAGEKASK